MIINKKIKKNTLFYILHLNINILKITYYEKYNFFIN